MNLKKNHFFHKESARKKIEDCSFQGQRHCRIVLSSGNMLFYFAILTSYIASPSAVFSNPSSVLQNSHTMCKTIFFEYPCGHLTPALLVTYCNDEFERNQTSTQCPNWASDTRTVQGRCGVCREVRRAVRRWRWMRFCFRDAIGD